MTGAPEAAGESIGAAHAIAGAASEARPASELADTAGRAFTDALGLGLTAAAAVALAGALLVLWRLPSDRPATADRAAAAPRPIAAPQPATP